MKSLREIQLGAGSILGLVLLLVGAFVASIGVQARTQMPAPLDVVTDCISRRDDACLVLVDGDQNQQRQQIQTGTDHGAMLGHDGTANSVLGDCAACPFGVRLCVMP